MERLNIVLVLGRRGDRGREGDGVGWGGMGRGDKKNPYAATEMNLMISGVGGGSPFLAPDNQN